MAVDPGTTEKVGQLAGLLWRIMCINWDKWACRLSSHDYDLLQPRFLVLQSELLAFILHLHTGLFYL
jgi:hypothetical protein